MSWKDILKMLVAPSELNQDVSRGGVHRAFVQQIQENDASVMDEAKQVLEEELDPLLDAANASGKKELILPAKSHNSIPFMFPREDGNTYVIKLRPSDLVIVLDKFYGSLGYQITSGTDSVTLTWT